MLLPNSLLPALAENWQIGGFGLYIHWPFCQAKCPYCDFNSHVSASISQPDWQAAYLSELDRVAAETGDRVLGSIFFGGGTPSLMDPGVVDAILTRVRKSWRVTNSLEITLEANPTSVEAGRFEGYRQAGVNRVSMGIQALNDPDLKRLGRLHTVSEAMQAFEIARKKFDRISFDLIYARQDQSLADWTDELTRALDLAADHLSLYQLTIEEGTAFGQRFAAGGLKGLPDDDLSADMFLTTQELTDAAGLSAYETSNHAREGAASLHNLVYWRGGDYLGVGPGAHGRITVQNQRFATDTLLSPQAWLDQVHTTGSGEHSRQVVPNDEQAIEYLMMGLRLAEGIDLNRYSDLAEKPLDTNDLVENGFLTRDGERLKATRQGRPVLNAILRELLT